MATREDLEAAGRLIGQEFALDSDSWAKWRESPSGKSYAKRGGGGDGGVGRRKKKRGVVASPPSANARVDVPSAVHTKRRVLTGKIRSEVDKVQAELDAEPKIDPSDTAATAARDQKVKYLESLVAVRDDYGTRRIPRTLKDVEAEADAMQQVLDTQPRIDESDPTQAAARDEKVKYLESLVSIRDALRGTPSGAAAPSRSATEIADELRTWGLEPGAKPSEEMLKTLTPEQRAKQDALQKEYDDVATTAVRPTEAPVKIDKIDQPMTPAAPTLQPVGKPFKRARAEERQEMQSSVASVGWPTARSPVDVHELQCRPGAEWRHVSAPNAARNRREDRLGGTMRTKGIRVHGSRPDGVLCCDIGDGAMVLVNVVDHVKTATLSERAANLEGPWRLFSGEVRLNDEVRERLQRVIEQPGNIVPPSAVGAIDYDHHTVYELGGPTRQEFADMLEAAHLSVGEELPSTQNFQDDSQWLTHCLGEIVPQMQQAGIEVGDPNTFCFVPGTMLQTETGLVPIEHIMAGMRTKSHTGDWNTCEQLIQTNPNYDGEVLEIRTKLSPDPLVVTPGHQVYAMRGLPWRDKSYVDASGRQRYSRLRHMNLSAFEGEGRPFHFKPGNWSPELLLSDIGFMPASDLRDSDYIVFPTARRVQDQPEVPEDLLALLGWYAGDGHLNQDTRVVLSLGRTDRDRRIAQAFDAMCRRYTGKAAHVTDMEKYGQASTQMTMAANRAVAAFVAVSAGRGASTKRFAPWVMALPPARLRVVLDAYWDADGHVGSDPKRQRQATTVSSALAMQIRDMLLALGQRPRLSRTNPASTIQGRAVNAMSAWVVSYQPIDGVNRGLQNDQVIALPITSIVPRRHVGELFDVTVSNDHSLTGTYWTAHNCALMHLERTGIMPRAVTVVVAPAGPAVPTPAQSTADMAVPAPTPLPSVPVALADNPFVKKESGDPMGTDDESVEDPKKPTAEEDSETSLGDGEPDGDEGGGAADDAIARGADAAEAGESGDADPVDAKVTEIEAALDAANGLIDELLGLLKVDNGEGFDSPDKTLAMNAKLSAVRKFAMPPEPNDAGLPGAVLPTPVSVAPHGVAGGAPGIAASDEPGKENEVVDPNVPGKPEIPSMPMAAAGPMMGGGGACIGKPNKKAVAACDTPKT